MKIRTIPVVAIEMIMMTSAVLADYQPHGRVHAGGGADPVPTVSVEGQRDGLMRWEDKQAYDERLLTPVPTPTVTPTPTETPTPTPTPTLYVHDVDVQINGKLTIENNASFQSTVSLGNGGAAKMVDWSLSNYQTITLDSTPTALTFTPPPGTCTVHLMLVQGAGGSKTVTWPTIKWVGRSAPVLSTAEGAIDIVALMYSGGEWYGMCGVNFGTP